MRHLRHFQNPNRISVLRPGKDNRKLDIRRADFWLFHLQLDVQVAELFRLGGSGGHPCLPWSRAFSPAEKTTRQPNAFEISCVVENPGALSGRQDATLYVRQG